MRAHCKLLPSRYGAMSKLSGSMLIHLIGTSTLFKTFIMVCNMRICCAADSRRLNIIVGGALTPTHTLEGKVNCFRRGAFLVNNWKLCQGAFLHTSKTCSTCSSGTQCPIKSLMLSRNIFEGFLSLRGSSRAFGFQ